jgi:DNA-binding transcriptional regulator YiaG
VKKSHYENLVAIVIEMDADKQRGRAAYDFTADRKALGLTQQQLSEALGISPRMVRYYESGEMPVPKAIALALQALKA